MTKIAVISDVHANKAALDLVLADIERRGVNEIVCLGDIVTKYYYPKACVDMISENCTMVVKGNCDNQVATNGNYKWAREQLGLERINYLDNLPVNMQTRLGGALINLYHSNPKDLESMFNPLFSDNDKTSYRDKTINDPNKMFPTNDPQVTIVGHTHMAYIGKVEEEKLLVTDDNDLEKKIILPTTRAIINVGSGGEVNSLRLIDGGKIESSILPYLTYLLLDDGNLEKGFSAQIIKVPYGEIFKQVFFESVTKQVKGEIPYSPNDTRQRGLSVTNQNPNDVVLKEQVQAAMERIKKLKR